MATLTSVKSGRWSDPTVWDAGSVPANGDSVTIASGHTVVFDVDQSSFTTGLAGLTINGTLFIPSQSEDSGMPDFVCLKVNANIAGTGSLLVGSQIYPITYPQSVKIMVNGSITVAVFNCYGEQRWPAFDYLAQNAAAGATQIVLTEGMPLRAGDIISIGRSDVNSHWTSGDNFTYTVTAYDPQTKTATISPALVRARRGGFPYGCLVILLTRQIVLSKFGSNSVTLVGGSGRILSGVQFAMESGSSAHSLCSASNVLITYSSFMVTTYGLRDNSNNTVKYTVFNCFGGTERIVNMMGNFTLENVAAINANSFYVIWTVWIPQVANLENIHLQNVGSFIVTNTNNSISPILVALSENSEFVVKYSNTALVSFSSSYSAGTYNFSVGKGMLVNCREIASDIHRGLFVGYLRNIIVYCDNTDFFIGYRSGGLLIENVTVNIASGRTVTISSSIYPLFPIFRNISVQGGGTGRLGQGGQIINCSIENAATPLASSVITTTSVRNLSVNAYYRPTLDTTYLTSDSRKFIFYDIAGLTVAGNSYPKARERIWNYGYVKNAWDDATPNYTTWRWYLTNTSLAAPMYLDYRLVTSDPIKVTGTILQLTAGEIVRVQIFRSTKEPLLGDTPDYEQVYSSIGSIDVTWTPPESTEWVIRIQVEMNQTSVPVVINDLRIQTIGEGSGGGSGSVIINVSDSTNLQSVESSLSNLSISETETNALTSVESPSVPMSLQLSENAEISSHETTQQMLSLFANDTEDLAVTESTNPTLSLSVSDDQLVDASESLSQFLYPAIEDSVVIDSSESVGLPIAMSVSDQVAATTIESVDFESNIVFAGSDSASIVASEAASNAFDISVGEVENIILSDQSQNELVISVLEPQEVISSSEHSMTSLCIVGDSSLNVIAAESVAAPISVTSDDIMTLEANESPSSTVVLTSDDNQQITANESSASSFSVVISETDEIIASDSVILPHEFVVLDQVNITTHELMREIHSTKVLHPLKIDIESSRFGVRIRRVI